MAFEYEYEWQHPDFDFSQPSEGWFQEIEDGFARVIARAGEDESVDLAAVYQTAATDTDCEHFLFMCFALAMKSGLAKYLYDAADLAKKWMDETDSQHPEYRRRREIHEFLVMMFNMDDEEAEDLDRRFDEADRLDDQGKRLLEIYKKTSELEVLREAIHTMALANQHAAIRHRDFPSMLGRLTQACDRYFERTGEHYYLDTIIDLLQMADPLFSGLDQNRGWYLSTLGKAHADRYERLRRQEDIDEAIRLTQLSVDHSPRHPQWRTSKHNLATWLSMRFTQRSSVDDLDRALQISTNFRDEIVAGDPETAQALLVHADILYHQFRRTKEVKYLDDAIRDAKAGTESMDPEDPFLHLRKNNLARLYDEKFMLGSTDYLDHAIELLDRIDKESRAFYYAANKIIHGNLASLLWKRFQHKDDEKDISKAIELGNKYLDIDAHDPDRGNVYCTLANCYGTRWQRQATRADLDRAIQLATKGVEAFEVGQAKRVVALNTLGGWLGRRFELVGALEDLSQAISLIDEALKAHGDHDVISEAILKINLGYQLHLRYGRMSNIDDLNRAIQLTEEALEVISEESPQRPGWLANLGHWLGKRFDHSGNPEDDKRSAEMAFKAVKATTPDSPQYGFQLTVMASVIASGGYPQALRRAMMIGEMALRYTPDDHPERAGRLYNVGLFHLLQFQRGHILYDQEEARLYFEQSWNCRNATPSIRVRSARKLAEILADRKLWSESSKILRDAIFMVPLISSRMLSNTDKQHLLADLAGLASLAAAVPLAAEESAFTALSHLELGRDVIGGQLLDMRTDISRLRKHNKKLAADLQRLRDELDAPSPAPEATVTSDSRVSRRYQAEEEFKRLLERIRKIKGFENFLDLPTEEELQELAGKKTVVVLNISPYRCDAFLLQAGKPIRNVLLETTEKEVKAMSRKLRASDTGLTRVLRWLWDKITGPILKELGYIEPPSDGKWDHVWWIPTGPLANFPLHAAGIHGNESTDTVLDRVISSYSSSIKALIHKQKTYTVDQSQPGEWPPKARGNAVLVAMERTPHGPGLRPKRLRHATKEIAKVRDLCRSINLTPREPERRKDAVLAALQSCLIFHFGGHGLVDAIDPSNASLLLEDWPCGKTTVGDLRDLHLSATDDDRQPPFLAYLSACTTGSTESERLVDEGISLASACHLAGFRHVVGTLWEVSDAHCPDVARVVYETLRDEGMHDEAVSRGLHFAVRQLREGKIRARVVVGRGGGGDDIPEGVVDEDTDECGSEYSDVEAWEGDDVERGMRNVKRKDERNVKHKKGYRVLPARGSNPLIWAPYVHHGG